MRESILVHAKPSERGGGAQKRNSRRRTGRWQIPGAWRLSVWSSLQQEEQPVTIKLTSQVGPGLSYLWELAAWRSTPRSRQRRSALLCCSAWWLHSGPEGWRGSLRGSSDNKRVIRHWGGSNLLWGGENVTAAVPSYITFIVTELRGASCRLTTWEPLL